MSSKKLYTEKEVRQMQRGAYFQGAAGGRLDLSDYFGRKDYPVDEMQRKSSEDADRFFPNPKITKTVDNIKLFVMAGGFDFKVTFDPSILSFVVDGSNSEGTATMRAEYTTISNVLSVMGTVDEDIERFTKELEDLKHNPTKTVEVDE